MTTAKCQCWCGCGNKIDAMKLIVEKIEKCPNCRVEHDNEDDDDEAMGTTEELPDDFPDGVVYVGFVTCQNSDCGHQWEAAAHTEADHAALECPECHEHTGKVETDKA